jgi:predicted XRE-type DNA-binding protein
MDERFASVWDALIDDPDDDQKKRSDYLILIQARLNGLSGTITDKAELLSLPIDKVYDLMEGRIQQFSFKMLATIARKAGVTAKP